MSSSLQQIVRRVLLEDIAQRKLSIGSSSLDTSFRRGVPGTGLEDGEVEGDPARAAQFAKEGRSENGWPASKTPGTIGITTLTLPLKKGNKSVQVAAGARNALGEIIKWWDQNVEPVEDLGGYNYREIRGYEGTGTLSNHASGTAVDINATKHALGKVGTVGDKAPAIRAKAKQLGLRWGGDYKNRKDEMYFEINTPAPKAEVERAVASAAPPAKPTAPAAPAQAATAATQPAAKAKTA